MSNHKQQTLALASLLQSTTLVHQLASTGQCDSQSNKASLGSIVNQSTKIEDIFKSPEDLKVGLDSLKAILDSKTKSAQNITLYTMSLINLEKKLMRQSPLLKKISSEIDFINKQDFFEIYHVNSIARLAELYKNTLGSLNPTIMVKGEQIYLSNQHTANHIRALLLAGIRAVSLWKSLGGKTWHLVLNKKKTLQTVHSLET
ncbi:MAG: high frequency lysogenization protein HflD [Gammaproteobacteria bacterium]|nr:high frequency lysogenization protein HflD [Gammaproteobacteria bacterium]